MASQVKKHVLFYCDDCEKLSPFITLFKATCPDIEVVTTSVIEDLIAKSGARHPELILVYLHNKNESYVTVLKEIRDNVDFSAIPVMIYRTLPDEKHLQTLFQKLSKA